MVAVSYTSNSRQVQGAAAQEPVVPPPEEPTSEDEGSADSGSENEGSVASQDSEPGSEDSDVEYLEKSPADLDKQYALEVRDCISCLPQAWDST